MVFYGKGMRSSSFLFFMCFGTLLGSWQKEYWPYSD